MSDPQMQPAPRLSSVQQFGYDAPSQELHIQFKSGPWIYVYSDIPPRTYSELLKSPHPGQYHYRNIKGKAFDKRKPALPPL